MSKVWNGVFLQIDCPDIAMGRHTLYKHMTDDQFIDRIDTNIQGAMALIQKYPTIEKTARKLVAQRTDNFLEVHDLQTYIAQNKREWVHLHSMLAGKQMKEDECLPYVFEKIL